MEAESNHQPRDLLHHHRPRSTRRQSVPGEIVEVQGGHIVRSTGRKDRHSKVCTAKGPRDRRVRLSAHTAIQFYDVQDRLGYDRPSKAVDWLINNSKAAIDELAQLPPWLPTATTTTTADPIPASTSSGKRTVQVGESSGYGFGVSSGSSFLPPSLESDAIADTIKFFFPVATSGATSAAQAGFHEYPPDLLSRSNSHTQDLRLSLQSFQDPMILHQPPPASGEQMFLDANWGGGYLFSVPGGNCSPFDAQRGPLQSNNSPAVQAWTDPVAAMHVAAGSSTDFASGGFSGFRVPARIQGEEEHHGGGIAQKLPEASRR